MASAYPESGEPHEPTDTVWVLKPEQQKFIDEQLSMVEDLIGIMLEAEEPKELQSGVTSLYKPNMPLFSSGGSLSMQRIDYPDKQSFVVSAKMPEGDSYKKEIRYRWASGDLQSRWVVSRTMEQEDRRWMPMNSVAHEGFSLENMQTLTSLLNDTEPRSSTDD